MPPAMSAEILRRILAHFSPRAFSSAKTTRCHAEGYNFTSLSTCRS